MVVTRYYCSDCGLVSVDAPGGKCGYCKYQVKPKMLEDPGIVMADNFAVDCIGCGERPVWNQHSKLEENRFYCSYCLDEMDYADEFAYRGAGPHTDWCQECYSAPKLRYGQYCKECEDYLDGGGWGWVPEPKTRIVIPEISEELEKFQAVR